MDHIDDTGEADLETLLRPRELAARLGVHPGTLRRWRRKGDIGPGSYVLIGRREYRYRWAQVLENLQARV